MIETVVIGAAIIGIINGIKKQYPQVTGVAGVVIAVLLGAAAGYLQIEGLTVAEGIVVGLSSSGVYKLSQNVGSK